MNEYEESMFEYSTVENIRPALGEGFKGKCSGPDGTRNRDISA